jgi:hypothetical protein
VLEVGEMECTGRSSAWCGFDTEVWAYGALDLSGTLQQGVFEKEMAEVELKKLEAHTRFT